MITFNDTTLAEPLKDYQDIDSLGKAHIELKNKIAAGDISILPEDLRKDPIVARYKNIPELAKGHIEANKIISGIKKAPETPDGYKFTELQNLHKGLINVEDTKKGLAQMFHKVGIDNDKGDQLQQMILTALSTGLGKNDENRAIKSKEAETKLRNDWGANYDKNLGNVENVLKRIGLDDLVPDLKQNPQRISSFHKLTSLLSEDSIANLGGEGGAGNQDTKTSAGATARIKQIMDSPALRDELANEKNPKYAERKKEWKELHETLGIK